MLSKGFVGIHTPKLNAGFSEGGEVFKLQYNGQPACLAQSPQLHKQMAISAGFERVFEVGPVFILAFMWPATLPYLGISTWADGAGKRARERVLAQQKEAEEVEKILTKEGLP